MRNLQTLITIDFRFNQCPEVSHSAARLKIKSDQKSSIAHDRFKGNDFDSKNIVSPRIVKWSDGPRLTTLQWMLSSVPNSSDRDGQTMFEPCDAKTIDIHYYNFTKVAGGVAFFFLRFSILNKKKLLV